MVALGSRFALLATFCAVATVSYTPLTASAAAVEARHSNKSAAPEREKHSTKQPVIPLPHKLSKANIDSSARAPAVEHGRLHKGKGKERERSLERLPADQLIHIVQFPVKSYKRHHDDDCPRRVVVNGDRNHLHIACHDHDHHDDHHDHEEVIVNGDRDHVRTRRGELQLRSPRHSRPLLQRRDDTTDPGLRQDGVLGTVEVVGADETSGQDKAYGYFWAEDRNDGYDVGVSHMNRTMFYLVGAGMTLPVKGGQVPAVVPAAIPSAIPVEIPATIPAAVPTVIPAAIPAAVSAAIPAAISAAVPVTLRTKLPNRSEWSCCSYDRNPTGPRPMTMEACQDDNVDEGLSQIFLFDPATGRIQPMWGQSTGNTTVAGTPSNQTSQDTSQTFREQAQDSRDQNVRMIWKSYPLGGEARTGMETQTVTVTVTAGAVSSSADATSATLREASTIVIGSTTLTSSATGGPTSIQVPAVSSNPGSSAAPTPATTAQDASSTGQGGLKVEVAPNQPAPSDSATPSSSTMVGPSSATSGSTGVTSTDFAASSSIPARQGVVETTLGQMYVQGGGKGGIQGRL